MKAVAYARYSTSHQTENSIAAQIKGITEYCERNNINLTGAYSDEARSGTNTNRDSFNLLLHHAREGLFEAVVVYDVTRGSRDVVDWFQFRKEMKTLGITIISATENLGDIGDPNTFLTELITVGIGQHQVLQTRQKSIAGKEVRALSGKRMGGKAPLGYEPCGDRLAINEREAEVIRLIFFMYANGKSYRDMIDAVIKTGVKSRNGITIGKNAIFSILKNDTYIGTYSWNREQTRYMHNRVGKPTKSAIEIEGGVPRIIDDETWERVRKRMDENQVNRTNKSRVKREYLMSGIVYCAECGGAMGGVTTINKKGHEYAFYSCLNKRRLHNCKARNIPAWELHNTVIRLLREDLLNGDIIKLTAEAIITATAKFVGKDISLVKNEIADLKRRNGNLANAISNGGAGIDALHDLLAENQIRIGILEEEQKKPMPIQKVDRAKLIAELSKDAERLKSNPDAIRELVKKYIVRIDISDKAVTIYAVAYLGSLKRNRQLFSLIEGGLTTDGSPCWI